MKEEEIEKGDWGPPTRKVYRANAFDSRLRGDWVRLVRLGSSPTKSQKKSLSPAGFRFVCWDQSLAVAESHVSPAATSWFQKPMTNGWRQLGTGIVEKVGDEERAQAHGR